MNVQSVIACITLLASVGLTWWHLSRESTRLIQERRQSSQRLKDIQKKA